MSHFDTILAMALAGGGGDGSSDFSTATVTIGGSENVNIPLVYLYDDIISSIISEANGTRDAGSTWLVPLYKGTLTIIAEAPLFSTITVSGNATVMGDGRVLQITGDCTFTAAGA